MTLEQSDFSGQSTGGQGKPELNNFKAYGWQKNNNLDGGF